MSEWPAAPPAEHLLRVVAPALGAAVDAGRLDAARAAVYVEECAGFDAAVVAAVVEASLPVAPSVPVEELGDELFALLEHLEARLAAHVLSTPGLLAAACDSPRSDDSASALVGPAEPPVVARPVAGSAAAETMPAEPLPAGVDTVRTRSRDSVCRVLVTADVLRCADHGRYPSRPARRSAGHDPPPVGLRLADGRRRPERAAAAARSGRSPPWART